MTIKTMPWDAAEFLNTMEDIAAYLSAALEDGDPDVINAALTDITRAKGLPDDARAFLRRYLERDKEPTFASIASALKTIGLPLAAGA